LVPPAVIESFVEAAFVVTLAKKSWRCEASDWPGATIGSSGTECEYPQETIHPALPGLPTGGGKVGSSVGEGLGDGAGSDSETSTTRTGRCPPSLLRYRVSTLFRPLRIRVIGPSPVTAGVTSTVDQEAFVTMPDVPTTGPGFGALRWVIDFSFHVVLPARRTQYPAALPDTAYTLRVAPTTDPDVPLTSNLMKVRTTGSVSVLRLLFVPKFVVGLVESTYESAVAVTVKLVVAALASR
jgi:hypothetical protein